MCVRARGVSASVDLNKSCKEHFNDRAQTVSKVLFSWGGIPAPFFYSERRLGIA